MILQLQLLLCTSWLLTLPRMSLVGWLCTGVVKELLKRAEGLFLYTSFLDEMVSNSFAKTGKTTIGIEDVQAFPDGMHAVYAEFFERLMVSLGNDVYQVGGLSNQHPSISTVT
jgi:hypothetical protein